MVELSEAARQAALAALEHEMEHPTRVWTLIRMRAGRFGYYEVFANQVDGMRKVVLQAWGSPHSTLIWTDDPNFPPEGSEVRISALPGCTPQGAIE